MLWALPLKGFKNLVKKVLYNILNFYENSNVNATNISANIETVNNPLKETIELFEKQLKMAREEFMLLL